MSKDMWAKGFCSAHGCFHKLRHGLGNRGRNLNVMNGIDE
jgi:hypothetical protein